MAIDAPTAQHALESSAFDEGPIEESAVWEETDDPVAAGLDAGDTNQPNDDVAARLQRRRRTAVIAGAAIVAVVLTVLIGLGGWFGYRIVHERKDEAHREFLIGVARQAAINLTTIDSATVDSDIKRILDSSTGTFHDDFQNRSAPFVQAVTQAQSKSQGTVTEAGLESQDGNDTQVLVAVSVKTSLRGVAEPQPRAWRMRITVSSNGERDAKVSNVQFVP